MHELCAQTRSISVVHVALFSHFTVSGGLKWLQVRASITWQTFLQSTKCISDIRNNCLFNSTFSLFIEAFLAFWTYLPADMVWNVAWPVEFSKRERHCLNAEIISGKYIHTTPASPTWRKSNCGRLETFVTTFTLISFMELHILKCQEWLGYCIPGHG